jgi:hypothetical protein
LKLTAGSVIVIGLGTNDTRWKLGLRVDVKSGEVGGDSWWVEVIGGVDGELEVLTTYGGELLGREVEEPVR